MKYGMLLQPEICSALSIYWFIDWFWFGEKFYDTFCLHAYKYEKNRDDLTFRWNFFPLDEWHV